MTVQLWRPRRLIPYLEDGRPNASKTQSPFVLPATSFAR